MAMLSSKLIIAVGSVRAGNVDSQAAADGYVLTADGVGNAAWEAAISGIADIVEDTTPQLGGDLDVNSRSIVSTDNGDIPITPDGTGKVILSGLNWPTADGAVNQVLATDGSGNLSFADAVSVTYADGGSSSSIYDPDSTVDFGNSTSTYIPFLTIEGGTAQG
jgi:hypothetical protein